MRLTDLMPNCFVAMLLGALPMPSAGAESVSFVKDVAPILAAKCVTCHGPEKS